MKSFNFFFIALTFFSSVAFAGQIGQFEVKSCSLVVSRDASQEMMSALMVKGFRPMNLLGAAKNPQDVPDLVGFPYLEDNSLNIKIVGQAKALFSIEEVPNCIEN